MIMNGGRLVLLHYLTTIFKKQTSSSHLGEDAVCCPDPAGPGPGDPSTGACPVSHQVNILRRLKMLVDKPRFIGIELDFRIIHDGAGMSPAVQSDNVGSKSYKSLLKDLASDRLPRRKSPTRCMIGLFPPRSMAWQPSISAKS